MLFQEWNILIVDDEPDVLTVSKLALRDIEVFGLPVRLFTAPSKAAAIDLLNEELMIEGTPEGSLAVAFIDVVMETEHAGLELCNYIRNELRNTSSQLYIRTGQPGIIPERDVIDKYDISGYFTKVEATEQKLYTFVKSGIRQWYSIYYANLIADFTNFMISNSLTKEQMLQALGPTGEGFSSDGNLTGLIFDNKHISSFDDHQAIVKLRDDLSKKEPVLMTGDGHCLILDGKRMLVHVEETETTAAYDYVAESRMDMPETLLQITFRNGIALSTLWKRAQD